MQESAAALRKCSLLEFRKVVLFLQCEIISSMAAIYADFRSIVPDCRHTADDVHNNDKKVSVKRMMIVWTFMEISSFPDV
jgi:hypothetical protein